MPRRPSSKYLQTGRQLKAARALAGMTQKELAKASGLHINTLKYAEQQQIITVSRWHTIDPVVDALAEAGIGVSADPTPMVWVLDCTSGPFISGHSARASAGDMGYYNREGNEGIKLSAGPDRQNDPADLFDEHGPLDDDHDLEWEDLEELGLDNKGNPLPKNERPLCGATTRTGMSCQARIVPGKRRCRMHGGMSSGPKTQEGRERIAGAQRERWRNWRDRQGSN